MTEHRSFKRLVRARMAKTGESYTAARARLLAAPEPGPAPVLVTSDAAIRERTGRGWEEWFDLLDGEGTAGRPHREISRFVADLIGVGPLVWAAQAVTTSYERARGGKAVGQKDDGFTVTASRTIDAEPEAVFDAVVAEERRRTWLGAELRERTATRPRRARFDHVDEPGGRVAITIDAKEPGRCVVAVEHSRLPDAAAAEKVKAWWRDRLAALKEDRERQRG
jgi:hypothetical protein